MAAGQVRTLEQALKARAVGLDIIAIGQGLVMNSDWVAVAKAGSTDVTTALDLSRTAGLAIPAKLRSVIENTPGWFAIAESKNPAAMGA
jgi:2,4-dienoyl-CoA reductase (NADPH2)